MPQPKGKERRRSPRVKCGGLAKIFAARTVSGTIKDLSRGGIFLQMPLPLFPVGGELPLKLMLPGDPRVFDATGEVRYHAALPPEDGGPGMGIKFLRLPREAEEAIGKFVDAHLAAETPWRT